MLHVTCKAGDYRDLDGMLFAAWAFQEVALAYYAHITRQRGAWNPDKATVLLTPKELAYVDLCVSVSTLLRSANTAFLSTYSEERRFSDEAVAWLASCWKDTGSVEASALCY